MEWNFSGEILLSLCLAIALFLFITKRKNSTAESRRVPPGPPGWPLIGNILDLGAAPHQSLASLSQKYGPVIWLQLGTLNTMVVSSAEAAKELFKNHDLSFSGRTTNEASKLFEYCHSSLAFGQYGPYWRMLRRICTTELFTNSRLNDTEFLRRKCSDTMVKWIWYEAREKGTVEIFQFVSLMMMNVISNLLLSKDIIDPQSKEGAQFFASNTRGIILCGKPNVADFFPYLRWLDPQRIKKKLIPELQFTHNFASKFVKERIQDRESNRINKKQDFLDVMLDFQGNQKDGEPERMLEENIRIMILELFGASTETSASSIEWAMAELLHNPSEMKRVQAELDQVVGQNNKVEEGDIQRLPFLRAVVKETLRLHPPVSLLIPRRARDDTQFMGYSVPKDTQVFVNVWAIGRDPVSWGDPLSFRPDRFMNCSTDYKGQHFDFFPFGAGRRICVGLPLAHRSLHLILGSLIHSFEWSLEDGVTPENMGMTERFGMTLRKANPLKLVPKLRLASEVLDIIAA